MVFLEERLLGLFLIICLPQSQESLLLQPIYHCCTLFEIKRTWKLKCDYLQTYNLKLSLSKTVREAFYLNSRKTKHMLAMIIIEKYLFCLNKLKKTLYLNKEKSQLCTKYNRSTVSLEN